MSVLHTLLVTARIARNEEHRYPPQHRGTVGVKGQIQSLPVCSIMVYSIWYNIYYSIYLVCSLGSSFRVLQRQEIICLI